MARYSHRSGSSHKKVLTPLLVGVLGSWLAAEAIAEEAPCTPSFDCVQLSVKRILDENGERSVGHLSEDADMHRQIREANGILERSGASWRLVISEIVDVRGIERFFDLDTLGDHFALERQAKENQETFAWNPQAINCYMVNSMPPLGVCSFPIGNDLITLNNTGDFDSVDLSVVWLHEIGHYFSLLHTFQCVGVDCTGDFDCTGEGALHAEPRGVVECPENCPDDLNVMSYNHLSAKEALLTSCQLGEMAFELYDPRGERSYVLQGSPPPAPQVVLHFDELPEQPAHDLEYAGVSFSFQLDGADSTDARFGSRVIVSSLMVDRPLLEGNARGVLTLDFLRPASFVALGVALSTSANLSPGVRVELFDSALNSIQVLDVETRSVSFFSEARFRYQGTPVRRVVLDFDEAQAERFAIDNLTFKSEASRFLRGDANEDGKVNLSDAMTLVTVLFSGQEETITCWSAADVNDDGAADVSDPIFILDYLFRGGSSPPAPFTACGLDPTTRGVGCESYAGCPVDVPTSQLAPDTASASVRKWPVERRP